MTSETQFSHYINNVKNDNYHPYAELDKYIPESIENINHFIFYGKKHIGKYSQILHFLSKQSPTNLKYFKKVCIPLQKDTYITKMSDIHIEVDLSNFGCNARVIWNYIYQHINLMNINKKSIPLKYIVCKHFEKIHPELLDVLYYYMKENKMSFIIHTNSIGFLSDHFLDLFQILYFHQTKYVPHYSFTEVHYQNITKFILESKMNIDIYKLRETLYTVFILHLDINDCIRYMYEQVYPIVNIDGKRLLIEKTYQFYQYYYNNYRSIYHLEAIVVNYIHIVNEYKKSEGNIGTTHVTQLQTVT